MSEVGALTMAAAAAAGALWARPLPLGFAAVVTMIGWGGRRTALLVAGIALVTSAMAARSWAGLHPPMTGWFDGTVTLAGDPVDVEGAIRVDVSLGGKHIGRGLVGRWSRLYVTA